MRKCEARRRRVGDGINQNSSLLGGNWLLILSLTLLTKGLRQEEKVP